MTTVSLITIATAKPRWLHADKLRSFILDDAEKTEKKDEKNIRKNNNKNDNENDKNTNNNNNIDKNNNKKNNNDIENNNDNKNSDHNKNNKNDERRENTVNERTELEDNNSEEVRGREEELMGGVTVAVGSSVEVVCGVEAEPAARLQWSVNGLLLKGDGGMTGGGGLDCWLTRWLVGLIKNMFK